MPTVADFYAVTMWTLRYWAFGWRYTIVRFRHIGLDIGTSGRPVDVPALWGGRVDRVVKTQSMGYLVILDTGLRGARRFHSYCHLSGDRLPRVGQVLRQGDRVGRLAAGPKTLPFSALDFPGLLWDGIHLHLVFSSHIAGAYMKGTGSTYANPEELIREVLAELAKPTPPKPTPAGGGSRPAPTTPSTTPTTPPAAEIEVLIMSATPFIAKVKKENGGSKLFLVQPNPLAASDPKAMPFLAFGWSGDSKELPVMDATADWIYNYLQMRVASINRS